MKLAGSFVLASGDGNGDDTTGLVIHSRAETRVLGSSWSSVIKNQEQFVWSSVLIIIAPESKHRRVVKPNMFCNFNQQFKFEPDQSVRGAQGIGVIADRVFIQYSVYFNAFRWRAF
jgi:hypothetical protein